MRDRVKAQLLRKLDEPYGWTIVIRIVVCGVAALFNGIAIGFQGNGNLILTGLIIGLILGIAWSVSLFFGLPFLICKFDRSTKKTLWSTLLVAALITFPIVSFHLWGDAIHFGIVP